MNNDYEFFVITLELREINNSIIDHDENIILMGILSRFNKTQLKDAFLRLWRESYEKFSRIFDIEETDLRNWINDPTYEKISLTIYSYLKLKIENTSVRVPLPITITDLCKDFRSIKDEIIIFVDFDNCGSVVRDLFSIIKTNNVNLPILCVAFCRRCGHSSIFDECLGEKQFRLIKSNQDVKDSADHDLTIAATLANEIVGLRNDFIIVSLDKFMFEVSSQLKSINPKRSIVAATPSEFRLILGNLFGDYQPSLKIRKKSYIIPDPFVENHFLIFLEIIQEHDVRLLSYLGNDLKMKGISVEKGGLKKFIDKGEHLGLLKRESELGTASIRPNKEKINLYIESKIDS